MKKKNILIGLTLISALSFAQEKNFTDKENLDPNFKIECNSQMMNRNNSSNMMNRNNPDKMMQRKQMKKVDLPKDLKLKLDKKRITMQELDLSVKKILLEDNVDWNKVLETNKKISSIQAEIRTSLQKFRHNKKIEHDKQMENNKQKNK
ncbi:hypothetical protein [Fusobacterium sp. IOR10]|uniref:hypothetical protein n=1 Tax=Fusobacterium sp. IOR10 TaxID=2665157 RepID=UPI0013D0DB64|nr:hypothetical protein [Fusobacterium sp. IOR10]